MAFEEVLVMCVLPMESFDTVKERERLQGRVSAECNEAPAGQDTGQGGWGLQGHSGSV